MTASNKNLLKVRLSEDFLFYSSFTHYNQLRPLLLELLQDGDKKIIAIASKQFLFQIVRTNEVDLSFKDLPIHIDEVYTALSRMSLELLNNTEYRKEIKPFIYKLWKLKKPSKDINLLFHFDELEDAFFLEEVRFICDFMESSWFPTSMNSFYRRLNSLEIVPERIILSICNYHFHSIIKERNYLPYLSSEIMEIIVRAFKKANSKNFKNKLLLFIDSFSLSNKDEMLKRLEAA
jgi:hypothetical protein